MAVHACTATALAPHGAGKDLRPLHHAGAAATALAGLLLGLGPGAVRALRSPAW